VKALLLVPALVLAASVGFLAASCGGGNATPAGPVPPAPAATTEGAETLPPPTTTNEEGETVEAPGVVTYQAWFANTDGLFVTYRSQNATPRVGTAALEALLEGPDSLEAQHGLSTSIPDGTQLLGLTIDDGVARADLTSEYGSGGGTLSMQTRLAQVVFTLTQFPTVDGVVFSLDGKPIDVLGGEGIIIDQPLTRRDYADLLPPILVVSPTFEENVASPVVVRGSANVFEANVLVEILDEDGETIAQTFTTATCGTGCRGMYRVEVPFTVDREQNGTVVVHDEDAAGAGRPPHEVRIPVRLVPR
jgi:germination protein M